MNTIIGKKVALKPITYDDTENIIRWRNSDFVRNQFLYRELFTRESHEGWLRDKVETGKAVQFIIIERSSGLEIGSAYLRDIDHANRKCEFGIFIGVSEKLGLGYGRESALLITQYAFSKLQMHKVFLRVLAENDRARKSYRSAGFMEEGFSRDDVWIDGQPHSVVFMARLEDEK